VMKDIRNWNRKLGGGGRSRSASKISKQEAGNIRKQIEAGYVEYTRGERKAALRLIKKLDAKFK